jgi:iron complex transport system substrate-binding protein
VWPWITLEVVVARAPDVIVDAAMGDDRAGRALFAALTTVPAVRDGRVVALPPDALFRAGPRVPEAARALAAAIHPEAFPPS